jgi:hypothetical protein
MTNTNSQWRSTNYRIYREQRLSELEKVRLPETQLIAASYKSALLQIDIVQKGIRKDRTLLYKMYKSPDQYKDLIRETAARITEETTLLVKLKNTIEHWGHTANLDKIPDVSSIRRCPTIECRGFLNAEFYCEICSNDFCSRCLEQIEMDNHICDPKNEASVAAINREAKSCPTCATLISKIDGCDQMWCTQCHTTFSWLTGAKETGNTHNPHYYEWMRKTGQVIPRTEGLGCDIPLLNHVLAAFGQDIWDSIRTITSKGLRNACLNKKLNRRQQILCALLWTHRHVVHMEHVVNQGLDYTEPDNLDLRVRYLVGELSSESFMKEIQKRDKRYRKNLSRHQVYAMTYTAICDLFRRFVDNPTLPSGNKILKEIVNLLHYSNTCLLKLDKLYGSKSPNYQPPNIGRSPVI